MKNEKIDLSKFKIEESQLKKILGGLTQGTTELAARDDNNCGLFCASCIGCTQECLSCVGCTSCRSILFVAATTK